MSGHNCISIDGDERVSAYIVSDHDGDVHLEWRRLVGNVLHGDELVLSRDKARDIGAALIALSASN